jgi:prevent-host-death family protein
MEKVGVRKLRDGLSSYLERVRAGETIEVTDRGETIARIVPAGIPEHLARLIAEGKASWSGRMITVPENPVRLGPGPPLSDYISEDRR